ncbi:unnamed protein product [Thelazia callipaeda]|uniref:Chitin-binding type-2 domain-containing protein n=1 Tax=Thelazia callipaeda TaxID=103827 RepID=A0A0N5CPK3_THECL|nr:unnamed protein product [Thelazia callipaeda]
MILFYSQGGGLFAPSDIPAGLCTHILYYFASFDDSGTSIKSEWNDEENEGNAESQGTYSLVTEFKNNDPELKVLLAYGGHITDDSRKSNFSVRFNICFFSKSIYLGYSKTQQIIMYRSNSIIAQSSENRKNFAQSAVDFLRRNNFDGMILQWEYPVNMGLEHATLVRELKNAFMRESQSSSRDQLLLTLAVSAEKNVIDISYDVDYFEENVDLIFLLSYDFHNGLEATVDLPAKLYSSQQGATDNAAFAANYWSSIGMPKEKIVIGISGFAAGWTLADASQTAIGARASGPSPPLRTGNGGGRAAYREVFFHLHSINRSKKICNNPNAKETVDKELVGAYLTEANRWYGYDNPETIKIKVKWLKEQGFAGAFLWSLNSDDFKGTNCGVGVYPLLTAINEALETDDESETDETTFTSPTPSTTLALSSSTPELQRANRSTTVRPSTTTSNTVRISTKRTVIFEHTDFKCPQRDGLFVYPNDCRKFYNCAFNYPFVMTCGVLTYYNDEIKGCDHWYSAPTECKKEFFDS